MRTGSLIANAVLLVGVVLVGCHSPQRQDPVRSDADAAVACLKAMLGEDKFAEDWTHAYPGCPDPLVRWRLNTKMDFVIQRFIVAAENHATPELYLALLKDCIKEFDAQEFDSEDCDRIGWNFERIMDCVGLESSDGALNRWRYGFDPTPFLRDTPR